MIVACYQGQTQSNTDEFLQKRADSLQKCNYLPDNSSNVGKLDWEFYLLVREFLPSGPRVSTFRSESFYLSVRQVPPFTHLQMLLCLKEPGHLSSSQGPIWQSVWKYSGSVWSSLEIVWSSLSRTRIQMLRWSQEIARSGSASRLKRIVLFPGLIRFSISSVTLPTSRMAEQSFSMSLKGVSR